MNGKLIKYPTIEERVEVCRIHLQKSIEWKGNMLGILEMRRHYANYFKGIDHFKDYRIRLVTLNVLVDIMQVLDEIEEKYSLTEAA